MIDRVTQQVHDRVTDFVEHGSPGESSAGARQEDVRFSLVAVSIRLEAPPAAADAGVHLASGVLESSNVNLSSCLVNMIELSRRFELQVRTLHTADEDAQSSTKLLQSGAVP